MKASITLIEILAVVVLLPLSARPESGPADSPDSLRGKTLTGTNDLLESGNKPALSNGGVDTLGGNLPRAVEAHGRPYLVVSDIYVPSGRTVKIEPGVVLLFKNFTGIHVEGRLVAEGGPGHRIMFSSEFDQAYNPNSAMHANPFDWNGIFIHESGIGSSLAFCDIKYSVYGINTLTKYIRLNSLAFVENGRSDLSIEGKKQAVTPDTAYCYALTIDDARKDGVPVKILMDPHAKKRSVFRYGGLSLFTAGSIMAIWCGVQASHDQQHLNDLKDVTVTSENSVLVKNLFSDWRNAYNTRNRDAVFTAASLVLALCGGTGFCFSFTF